MMYSIYELNCHFSNRFYMMLMAKSQIVLVVFKFLTFSYGGIFLINDRFFKEIMFLLDFKQLIL